MFLQVGVVFYSDLNMHTAPGLPIWLWSKYNTWNDYAVQQQSVSTL